MLFRRFAIVTVSIALMGIAVSNIIESTHSKTNGFAVEERLKQWKAFDARKACEQNEKLCYLDQRSQVTI
ncbi:MAG: hypothetical protein ABJM29_07320 [Rhizobiaceae bacterium]